LHLDFSCASNRLRKIALKKFSYNFSLNWSAQWRNPLCKEYFNILHVSAPIER